MAIEKNETIKERYKFLKTKEWIDEEFIKLENKFNHYEEKISSLKKSSGGTYSDDLLLAQKVFEFVTKNLHKYKEAKEQPYFARIDFREKRREAESFYIGKFGLNDEEQSEEVVIDWRAPLANLYYSGTFGQSYYNSPAGIVEGELSLKRKFLVKDGNIAEMFDEGINELIVKTSAEGDGLVDEFLKVTLEQSMSKKLKDVVATIQKEQNEIIRAYKNKPIIIQGSAGSGKTTVALHRLAYLIYTYSNEEKNGNILVVAPNKLFLDYISDVLPNLGVYNVKQNTYEELCVEIMKVKGKIITKDEKLSQIIECEDSNKIKYITSSSKVKGSLVFKSILDRYIKYLEAKDTEVEDIEVEGYILFTSKEVKRLYIRDLAHLPAKKRKDEIKKYFESKMKYKISDLEELIDKDYGLKIRDIKSNNSFSEEKKREIIINIYDERDEKKKSLKSHSTKALKEFFTNWKSLDLYKSYSDLFNDENVFKDIAKDIIPDKLYQYMREELNHNHEKKVIDSDDLTPLTYLKLKFEGNTVDKFMHIVVDEAQDYSYFQMYLLNEISQNNSMTIVGDLGQGIYNYKGIGSWNKLIESVFREDGTYISLSQSYRSTVEIINLANKVLEKQKLHLTPAIPVLRHGDNPKIIKVPSKDHEVSIIDLIIQEVHEKKKHSVAVICKNYSQCKELYKVLSKKSSYSWILVNNSEKNINMERLIIPSYMTKGLEFDATIIYECDEENYNDDDLDKRLLYVALTRALHLEYIMYSNSLTKLLE